MAVFAVLADKPNPALERKIMELYPFDFHKLSDAEWLVSADTIANALAEQLQVRAGEFGRTLVIQTLGIGAGWHSRTTWEWLKQKAEHS